MLISYNPCSDKCWVVHCNLQLLAHCSYECHLYWFCSCGLSRSSLPLLKLKHLGRQGALGLRYQLSTSTCMSHSQGSAKERLWNPRTSALPTASASYFLNEVSTLSLSPASEEVRHLIPSYLSLLGRVLFVCFFNYLVF